MSGRPMPTKGVTVHERGSGWYYRLDLEPDPLTGKRQRENRGGFESEDAAWKAAMASKQRHAGGRLVRSTPPDTVELLRAHLAVLDMERAAFGEEYDTSHGKHMRYEDGRRLHADAVTRRFNRLMELAGVRRIRLHDIRHTHATLWLDSGVHAKIVSDRIGHAHEGITVQIYGHRSTGHDREAAELVAGLIRWKLDAGPTTDAG